MHDDRELFPRYIPRTEEQQLLEEVAAVRRDRTSRTVLVYGSGGVGKTSLVRAMAGTYGDERTRWLDPVDVDDPEFWLLSNLEQKVAEQLDPDGELFQPYWEYLSRFQSTAGKRDSHENVVSQLSRIKSVFIECYESFVEATGKTVVIVFDTVEAIRGMYLLVTLTQWMKALPATLFILSGRPMPDAADTDPIEAELRDPHQSLAVTHLALGGFTREATAAYLESSGIANGVSADERTALVHLTRGHPLWLAFTVAYLQDRGMPEEATTMPLADIEAALPYGEPMTTLGQDLHEEFKRRLVTPYRRTDFWSEAVKRLAVVRHSVNKDVFTRLMADHPNPPDAADAEEIWQTVLSTPWIRARANRRYVTLHDAVAEELAQRIIPVHDQDGEWRRRLWDRARVIYSELTDSVAAQLTVQLEELGRRLRSLGERLRLNDENRPTTPEERDYIRDAARLDSRRRELDQLNAVGLHYQLLSMPMQGCRRFIELFDGAQADNEILRQERLAVEMQRFLPDIVAPYTLGDVVSKAIEGFRSWLSAHPSIYLEVGLRLADHLVDSGQSQAAIDLLHRLPAIMVEQDQGYRLNNHLGNAYLRTAGKARDGLKYFELALAEAEHLGPYGGRNLIADAYKELGFYQRQVGNWADADTSYRRARDAIVASMDNHDSEREREEMASIQTNWAYIKGLRGSYGDATNLIESAIAVRHRLGKLHAEGLSWSVRGEIYRYERRWEKAWESYATAENIFQGLQTWPELGLVYQEEAICLFQAAEDGTNLTSGNDPAAHARRRITIALSICRDDNQRAYPSALNRAGRIFGATDIDLGLNYLRTGIFEARALSDGWFWFANLVEYAELSYRAWAAGRGRQYRDRIGQFEADIGQAADEYQFPDLEGRWRLLQGHLALHDWADNPSTEHLEDAFAAYAVGFILVAQAYVGSSGASAIPAEFQSFKPLFQRLPRDVQADWRRRLRATWSDSTDASTVLLARLEELY